MDIYGIGQEVGALLVCLCNKRNCNVREVMNEIRKAPSMLIDGIGDGVGGNADIGASTNNAILDNLKL